MKSDNILRYSILSLFAIWITFSYPSFSPLPEITSKIVSWIANLINIQTVSYKDYLIVNFGEISRIFHLSAECSGIVLFSVFLFGTFLIPQFSLKHKLISLIFIPILILGNSIRILLSVIIAKNYSVNASLLFHDTLGQVFMFSVGIFAYVGWLKITKNFPTPKDL